MSSAAPEGSPASLLVTDPGGHRTTVPLVSVPFRIGRQPDNDLVLRDTRASRTHCRIVLDGGDYWVEDLKSRHGTFVNGVRAERHRLQSGDRIEFGTPDSYSAVFTPGGTGVGRLIETLPAAAGAGNLAKLRAVMEVARALETSLSTEDVLASVVAAALAVTGAERGFLLLRSDENLEMRVARDRHGRLLGDDELTVPRGLIRRALERRRELLAMSFDPLAEQGVTAERSVANLELRSVVCVPLVRIRGTTGQETSRLSAADDTVGLLYMDSRLGPADLAAGNRELLQTLALEASTVLENARLLEEERAKHKMEEELQLARRIQESLFPRSMPSSGWFRAQGVSLASLEVGGDYFDLIRVSETRWAAAVADVSGKGVASALLACYLQGALTAAASAEGDLEGALRRINRFLCERAESEKYATLFLALVDRDGALTYVNAAHCPPLLAPLSGPLETLEATGMPVGLVPAATFPAASRRLSPGDKLVVYSDGVTEARAADRQFYGLPRLQAIVERHRHESCAEMEEAVLDDVRAFTQGVSQADDITLLVLEYAG